MEDFKSIRAGTINRLSPDDTINFFNESLFWLKSELSKNHDLKTVVVTHHAPSLKSIEEQYRGQSLSAAYASDLDDVVAGSGAVLWIHGHTHSSADYLLGNTRVVCNPRGYAPHDLNHWFKDDLVIEI